jgi:serine/threonine protein kinase
MPDRVYRPGDFIGGEWRVLRAMEGGLGLVYAVEHRESGDRRVLKAPKRQSDPAVRESFRAEAETWVRLGDHPNIVCAQGVDEFAGQVFVIAELIEPDELGRVSLRDYLPGGALTPHAVAALAADFCYGMAHARAKGMVAHRDIKPENLLIGASGKLRVTDFGLARAMVLGAAGNDAAPGKLGGWQTHDGKISGTPYYMPPEQWQGGRQDITADIYAFGVVMYEMCYGRLPFTGADLRDLAAQHLTRQPDIPGGMFAPVIARCLAKDRAARYPDTLALLADLARVCGPNGVPLPPKPVVSGQKARELAALARGLAAVGKPEEALASVRKLVEIEPESAGHWTEMGRLLFERGDDTAAIAAMERSLALDETRSPAWNNFGLALKRAKKWQQAVFAFDRATDCDPFNTAPMLNSSEPLLRLGQAGQALLRLKRAAEIAPDKFQIWVNLAAVYIELSDKKNALECLRKAFALAPERYHGDIARTVKVVQDLPDEPGALALMQADPAAARKQLEAQTRSNPRDKTLWHNLGLLHLQANDQANARNCFERVLELDPKDNFAICRLIETSQLLKDIDAAMHWCEVLKGMPGGQMPSIAFMARALVHCDRYDDARKLILDAVRKHPEEPDILIACGDVMMTYPGSSTAMSNAVAAYGRAVDILKKGVDIARAREIEGRLETAKHYLDMAKREAGRT